MSGEPETSRRHFAAHDRIRSFAFAWNGLRFFVATQHNAWIHLAATVTVLVLSAWLRISADDWRWIVLAIAIVWIAEALNTAVEQLGDAISVEHDTRIGLAKDVAAGAVLLSAIASALIGTLTLVPYIF